MDKMINLDRHYMLNVIGKVDELSEMLNLLIEVNQKQTRKLNYIHDIVRLERTENEFGNEDARIPIYEVD